MMHLMLLSTFSTLIILLPLMMSPIEIGVWIFMLAMTASALVSLSTSTWFGLILFIIYIGGMLVMFSYFVASTPNQIINMSTNFMISICILALCFFFLYSFNFQTWTAFPLSSPLKTSSFALLFSSKQAPLLLFLAILLLIALIYVVKIANKKGGPLRPFIS